MLFLAFLVSMWASHADRSAQSANKLTKEDVTLVCAVGEVALASFNVIVRLEEDGIREKVEAMNQGAEGYKRLPHKIRCGSRSIRFKPRGYGIYITDFTVSADREQIVMSGGYQGSVLDGADGFCLFRRAGATWEAVGCEVTGLS